MANILNSAPFPGQAEELKRFLSEYQSNGYSLSVLINYNIPRYNGRTLVHIAGNNGLCSCCIATYMQEKRTLATQFKLVSADLYHSR